MFCVGNASGVLLSHSPYLVYISFLSVDLKEANDSLGCLAKEKKNTHDMSMTGSPGSYQHAQ